MPYPEGQTPFRNNPYGYSYFKPTGKEQGAMAIGSLLAGLLAAGQPRQQGEASPALKGITGAVGGYGSGYKAYQDMMGDAFTRDLYDRKFGQDTNQFDQQMGLNKEKFGEEKRQYEETDKPYKQAVTKFYNERPSGAMGTTTAGMSYFPLYQKMYPDIATRIGTPQATEEDVYHLQKFLSDMGYNSAKATDENGNPIFTSSKFPTLKAPTSLQNNGNEPLSQQPPKGKFSGAQPFINPTLAESAQENIARGDTLQQNINRVRDLHDKTYVGAVDALQGKTGEIYGGATGDKEKQFRSAVNSLYTNMFAEGGKALTEPEQKILRPLFPSFWRGEENFLVDLGGLETKYKELMNARLKTHKDAGMRNIDKVQEGLTQSNAISLPENIKTYSEAINYLTKNGMSQEQAKQWIEAND